MLSGTLWSCGITSFLGTRYWGNGMIGVLVLLVLLSLKADTVDDAQQQSSNNIMYKYVNMLVPCIDYVSWNGDGELADGSVTGGGSNQSSMHTRTNNSSNDVDIEMGGSSNNNAERGYL